MSGNILLRLGPFALTRFGLLLGAGALLWLLTALWTRRARFRRSVTPDQVAFAALWMLLLGAACSRAAYCLANFDRCLRAADGPARALRLWEGGASLCGALLGATAGLCLAARLSGARAGRLANCFAPGWGLFALCAALALRQTGEGWGKLVDADCLAGTLLAVQDRYGDWRFAVYRLDAAAGALAFLAAAGRAFAGRRPRGWNAYALAVGLWAAARVVTASMREGDLLRVEYFRVEQLGAMAALVAIAACRVAADRRAGAGPGRLLRLLPLLAGAAVATAMEFAVDREGGLEWKYCVMLGGALLCWLATLPALRGTPGDAVPRAPCQRD